MHESFGEHSNGPSLGLKRGTHGMAQMKSYENLNRVIEDLANEEQSTVFAMNYSSLTKPGEEVAKIGSARNINRSMDKMERE